MSSNVGLTTPRGSGTSGYVQRNLSHLKPRDNFAPYPKDYDLLKHRQRKPDKEILDHDRLREVEVKVYDLRDKLEDEGVDEEEIEFQTSALRQKLSSLAPSDSRSDRKGQFKPHQVHELAQAKIEESEKLRKALGISANYEEGSHWKKQEERLRDGLGEKERDR
ncbi:hypothetical protein HO133_000185 [Letharia lupina]|uniref:CWF21 domain-containing protein n=1 Tax=Letharia lupina TaxID=560253 RepID=A0A8H6CH73_9LECA|nr:uncharacterized protein HO133_000185 [Letharia lupina]KAF6223343.1 hypothetical protein HO133_000185 [Letharia lupina]